MFTVVRPPQVFEPRRTAGEPRPEIIDHRDKHEPKKWKDEDSAYKHLKQQRDRLLESETMYKKTIKELEKEKAELINVYEPTYNENKVLKSVLQHGPDAVKMKKLQKARKELEEEVETLKAENNKFAEQMNELIKKHAPARNDILEKNWKDVLARGKRRKEKNETKNTQGPFSQKEFETNRTMFEDETIKKDDAYDLQLDNVENEIKILLNNVKYIKSQKEKVDYAISMRKGAIVKNPALENAIYDKLDNDLKAFKRNLKSAKRKHEEMKQKVEQTEKDVPIQTAEVKAEKQEFSENTMTFDKTKIYKTSETQTDGSAVLKPADQLISHKKKYITPRTSRAVQTDLINAEDIRKTNRGTMTYLDQYECKRKKLREEKQMSSKNASSRSIRTKYAKKLVYRRGASPDRIGSTKQVSTQTIQDISQENNTRNTNKNTLIKRNETAQPNCRDKHVEPLPILEKAKPSIQNSRIKSKSVEYLNKQQIMADFEDKIMIPETNITPILNNKQAYQPETNLKKSKIKSRSNIDVRMTESFSKHVPKKHKVSVTLPDKQRYSNRPISADRYSWKSESDLHNYTDKEINSFRPVKELNVFVPQENNHVHFKGELVTEEYEKRDESAYDMVLADLYTQNRQSADGIDQEFERTVQTFREHKNIIREKQKFSQQKSDFFPSLTSQAPIRFTSKSRQVTGREVRQLLEKSRIRFT